MTYDSENDRVGGGGSTVKKGKQSAVFLSFQRSTQVEDARVPWLCAGRQASLQKMTKEEQVSSLPYKGNGFQSYLFK